jgi:hypothetical protein
MGQKKAGLPESVTSTKGAEDIKTGPHRAKEDRGRCAGGKRKEELDSGLYSRVQRLRGAKAMRFGIVAKKIGLSTKELFRHLKRAGQEELDRDDPDVEIDLWPDTSEGKRDLLIDDCLALESKVSKAFRESSGSVAARREPPG